MRVLLRCLNLKRSVGFLDTVEVNNLHHFRWHSVRVTLRPGLPKIHTYNKLNPVWWFKTVTIRFRPQGTSRMTSNGC
jgi:hypothetical protein